MNLAKRTYGLFFLGCIVSFFISEASFAGGLRGTVRDNQGSVIGGVSVELYSMDGYLLYSKVSGTDGIYFLELIPEGNYNLKILGQSCPFEVKVAVKVGPPASLDLTLPCSLPKAPTDVQYRTKYLIVEPVPVPVPVRDIKGEDAEKKRHHHRDNDSDKDRDHDKDRGHDRDKHHDKDKNKKEESRKRDSDRDREMKTKNQGKESDGSTKSRAQ